MNGDLFMKKWFMLIIVVTFFLGACTTPTVKSTQTTAPSATAQPSAIPTMTSLSTFTPEPTTPPEAFVVQDDGTLAHWNKEKEAYEPVPRTGAGLYLMDGQLVGWDTANNQPVEAFKSSGGNLRRWDQEAGRYRQVTVEINSKPENVKAQELHVTELGLLAEYNGGATALINPTTGEATTLLNQIYLKDQTTLTPAGALVVWDGENHTWIEPVQIKEGQLINWDGRSFVPLKDTLDQPISANQRLEMPQGVVYAQDGVLTAVVDRNHPVAAYKGEAQIGFKVYRLENGGLVDTGRTWLDWQLYEPNTGEPRADLFFLDLPNAATVDLDGIFVSRSILERGDPAKRELRGVVDNPSAIISYFDSIIREVSSDPNQTILSFKANDIADGQLGPYSNFRVRQLKFFNLAQVLRPGMPQLPLVMPFASSPEESRGFGMVYDPQTESLIIISELNDSWASQWMRNGHDGGGINLAGWMIIEGLNFPSFPTDDSQVSGRLVMDRSSNRPLASEKYEFQSGLVNYPIKWRAVK